MEGLLKIFKSLQRVVTHSHYSFRDGNSLLSWKDNWSSIPLQKTLPHLFSFAQNEVASVHTAISSTDLSQLFHLPLSDEALDELYELQTLVNSLEVQQAPDSWEMFISTSTFRVSKAYKSQLGHEEILPASK